MTSPNKPSCFNCIHADVFKGFGGSMYEPPEPPSATCKIFDEVCELTSGKYEQMEAIDFDEDKMPELCGRFNPIMVEKCHNCKKPINRPAYSWPHWETSDEPVPVCGETCKEVLKAKFQAFLDRNVL